VFTVQPTSTTQNATITPSITVTVRDAGNRTITTSTATITLSITPLSGSPAGRLSCIANPKTAVAGVATFGGCSINKKDTGYTLTAASPGSTSAVSATFNIT
jgi:trimeric autotransporter adhesin